MSKYKVGDLVRIQYVPNVEHPSLMSETREILRTKTRGDGKQWIDVGIKEMNFTSENLRHAYDYEILEYKLCQYDML